MKLFCGVLISLLLFGAGAKSASAFEAGGIDIHGYISQGYLLTDQNNYMADTEDGTFQFNEMGLNLSKDVTDSLRIAMQIFSRDLGDVGNNNVVFGYAYGDYRWKNWLGLRAGKIKTDYGLYNETRETDMLRTAIMLPQSVYPELWRDSFSSLNGAAVYGNVPAGFAGKLSYNFQIGAMEFNEDEGFARTLTPRMDERLSLSDIEADYGYFLNLQWHTPLSGLKLKGSYYRIEGLEATGNTVFITREGEAISSAITYDINRKDGYVISLEYLWKNLTAVAEYSEDTYDFDMNFENSSIMTPQGGGPPKVTSQGWYGSVSYRFTDWFESGLSYSEYYPNKDNKDGNRGPGGGFGRSDFQSWLKTSTLTARFDISEFWTLKLEASYNDGFGGVNLADNNINDIEQYWWLFAAKLTFSF